LQKKELKKQGDDRNKGRQEERNENKDEILEGKNDRTLER
jgi:hypothetical protein